MSPPLAKQGFQPDWKAELHGRPQRVFSPATVQRPAQSRDGKENHDPKRKSLHHTVADLPGANNEQDANPKSSPLSSTYPGGEANVEWQDELDQIHSQNASRAFLPIGYKPLVNSALPWQCPIRGCRSRFHNLSGLRTHFTTQHVDNFLKDNLDGSFSILPGSFSAGCHSKTSLPALVVSQHPRSTAVTKMPQKSRPQQTELLRFLSTGSVLEYLLDFLPRGYAPPDRHDVGLLKLQPRLRDLAPYWKMRIQGSILPPGCFAAVLLHLVGTEADLVCSECLGKEVELTGGCIVAGPNAPLNLQRMMGDTCSLCLYECQVRHEGNRCSFDHATPGGRESAPQLAMEPDPSGLYPHVLDLDATDIDTETSTSNVTNSGADSDADTHPDISLISVPSPTLELVSSASSHASIVRVLRRRQSSPNYAARRRPYSVGKTKLVPSPPHKQTPKFSSPEAKEEGVTAGDTSIDSLPIEEWEVSPGRVRTRSGEATYNVAFSSAYLTANQPVAVSTDIGFHVLIVKAGTVHHSSPEIGKTRICSIAGGKLRVSVDQQNFDIGPNGMFKVMQGVSFTAENRLYMDAVVHITTIHFP